jgi:hypothetical protein
MVLDSSMPLSRCGLYRLGDTAGLELNNIGNARSSTPAYQAYLFLVSLTNNHVNKSSDGTSVSQLLHSCDMLHSHG